MDGGDAEVEAALPRNLIRRAVTPLVALHGQDALHEQLAALMDKVRAVPLHKLSPSTPKPKRGSYDGVRAGGILKAGWLDKHTNRQPAATAALAAWPAGDAAPDALAALVEELGATRQHFAARGQPRAVSVLVVSGGAPADVEQRFAQVVQSAGIEPRLAVLLDASTDAALREGADRLCSALAAEARAAFEAPPRSPLPPVLTGHVSSLLP
jgi:hypothetical protein